MAKSVLVIFVFFIQTGISTSVPNLGQQNACKCELYSKCTWSKKMVNQIAVLEKTNPIRLTLSQQFTLQVCDTAKRHVWCCRDGEQATNSELKQLDEKEIFLSGKIIYKTKSVLN